MEKRRYTKGMMLIHLLTKQKVIFGAFDSSGESATCLDKDKRFVQIPRAILETEYKTPGELEKRAKEKRKGQAW